MTTYIVEFCDGVLESYDSLDDAVSGIEGAHRGVHKLYVHIADVKATKKGKLKWSKPDAASN